MRRHVLALSHCVAAALFAAAGYVLANLRADWFNLHKSVGLTVGLLMLLRLLWRFARPAPPLPGSMPACLFSAFFRRLVPPRVQA